MKKTNIYFLCGIILMAIVAAIIVVGFFWTPYVPTEMSAAEKLLSPSTKHIMGTDNFGRDIFSRVMKGAGTTVTIALATVAIGGIVGAIIGAVTGFFGGIADDILMRLGDVLTAFPSILLALVIVNFTGSGSALNIIIALGIVFIPSYARVTRSAFASIKDANYIKSATLIGVPKWRILFVHILPNTISTLLPAITIGFNNAVLAEASMSYLGIGVTPPNASLGYMLSEAQGMLSVAPWYALCTGFTLIAIVFGSGLLGAGLLGAADS